MKSTVWMKQVGFCLVVIAMMAEVAYADPTGSANVPQIVEGVTGPPGLPPILPQRTFLTTDFIAVRGTYYDPNPACASVAPTLAQTFVFNLQGVVLFTFPAFGSPSSLGAKYRDLGVSFPATNLGPGAYKYTFLVRDCTNTISVVQPELITFAVLSP